MRDDEFAPPATTRGTWRSGRLLLVTLDDGREFRFARSFTIGRGEDCDVRIENREVSRKHVTVSCERGRWTYTDSSRNGVFVDGTRLPTSDIGDELTITLGADGPTVTFAELTPEVRARAATPPPEPAESNTIIENRYAERYFKKSADEDSVGPRTLMIRKAYERVQKRQRRQTIWIVSAALLVAAVAGGYAYYNHLELEKLRAATEEEFYAIKEKDVLIAQFEESAEAGDPTAESKRNQARAERLAQLRKVEAAMNELVYKNLNETDRLILRVTRRLGECELAVPPDYLDRVKVHIARWRSTGRFARSLKVAQANGYLRVISKELLAQDLPPDFFYLAMQESDFNPGAVGPSTRFGYAKGMWQFIPETGLRFGLKPGPLQGQPKPDAADERQDWAKATVAAARYIKDIYTTDAKASGLLVMASYNWGEHRIIDRVRELPSHPRDRNFWKLIQRFKIPGETYDYVFNIVAAAVIGENPRAFSFDFDNPLADAQLEYDGRQ